MMKISHSLPCRLIILFILLVNSYPASSQVYRPFKEVVSIPPGKAVIYIYWPNFVWNKYSYFVTVNDKPASNLPLFPKGCLVYYAEPGICVINLKPLKNGDLVVQVNEGEKYFVRGVYDSGPTTFRLFNPAEALKDLRGCWVYKKPDIIDSDNFRTIALLSVTMSKPIPGSTFGDETYYNLEAYPVMKQIIDLEKVNVYSLRETAARELKEYFKAGILYGDSLNRKSQIPALKEKYDSTSTFELDGKYYPSLITVNDDLIPFPGYKTDIDWFFRHDEIYRPVIAEISQSIKADIFAICNTNFVLYSSGKDFNIYGTIGLDTRLYFFNPEGTLLMEGKKEQMLSGNRAEYDIRDYENALGLFPVNFDLLLEDFTLKINKKLNKK